MEESRALRRNVGDWIRREVNGPSVMRVHMGIDVFEWTNCLIVVVVIRYMTKSSARHSFPGNSSCRPVC